MNAYFQLVAEGNMTAVRLVPATDGGDKLNINEMMDYLHLKKIDVQNIKQLYQVALNYDKEIVVPVCDSVCLPQQEMMTVKISDDRMEAVARFYPPSSNGGSYRDKGDVIDDLRFHKITYGYDEAVIEKYMQNRSYCTDIVIARGTAPIHGTDAVITYYFNTDLKTRPSRNEDGSVDFFHLNTINHCKTGDVLASLKKAEEGVNGTTVYGEVIRPRTIKHLVLKHGRNIEVSEDGCEMRSLINGHVCLTDDKVFVSDVYEVENVGTATGNIESEGSVQVNGNVQAGFEIRAKGNVEVRGVVEGAVIEAGGDIIIARGMNGMGKGILRAGGRVILKCSHLLIHDSQGFDIFHLVRIEFFTLTQLIAQVDQNRLDLCQLLLRIHQFFLQLLITQLVVRIDSNLNNRIGSHRRPQCLAADLFGCTDNSSCNEALSSIYRHVFTGTYRRHLNAPTKKG